MNIDDYQEKAMKTAVYPQGGTVGLSYTALGLAGEAGEVAEKVKKIIRDDDGSISLEKRNAILKEMSDVFWYLAAMATELDAELSNVLSMNLDKLQSRMIRGVIKGNGDDR
jgi:NTP pyrophosphatase (non-canonical NTP hydrolase)